MTNRERNISRYNKMKARKRFGILGRRDLVLHHKDPTLRHNNIKRYIQWNDEDLEVMNLAEHTRLHHLHSKHSEETKRKISQSNTGKKKPICSEEYRHKMSLIKKGHGVSMETRMKISKSHKGKSTWMLGQTMSEEQKEKISKTLKGHRVSNETRKKMADAIRGRHWYNNGTVQIQAFECPEGFVTGRLYSKRKIKE